MRIPRYVLAWLFVTALGVIVAWMVLEALGFSETARTVPLVIGIPTLVLIVIQIIRDGIGVVRSDPTVGAVSEIEQDRYARAAADQREAAATAVAREVAADRSTSMLGSMAWVGALALLIWLAGLLIAIPVFTAAFMKIFGRERWTTIAAFAVGTAVAVYAFFTLVLDVRLYSGLFGDAMPWL